MSSTTISVRLPDELSDAVDEFSAMRGMKPSEAVRELIQLGLKAQDSAASDREFPVSAQLNVLFEDLKSELLVSHENVAFACLHSSHEAAEAVWALVQLQSKALGVKAPTREQLSERASRRLGEWIALAATEELAEGGA